MPYRPIPTDIWRKFLKHIGCEFVSTKKHEKWTRADLLRPVIFRSSEPEIPAMQIQTNLKTLGMTWKQMEQIIAVL